MSVQEFSQGPRFAIFCPRGRKIKCHNLLFSQTGARHCRGLRCIAPIAPVLKAPLSKHVLSKSSSKTY